LPGKRGEPNALQPGTYRRQSNIAATAETFITTSIQ
jgi:hypothetical protein